MFSSITDKPTPPLGPLDVSDITPETCSLSWRPPNDDGGSPITNYVVERLDPSINVILANTYSIQCKLISKICIADVV